MLSSWAPNFSQFGVPGVFGFPCRAKLVQYLTIWADSWSWLELSGVGERFSPTPVGLAAGNRYWISEACAALYPLGKPATGGRKSSGAFSSLNSYTNVSTNRDVAMLSKCDAQAKIASVPTAPTA